MCNLIKKNSEKFVDIFYFFLFFTFPPLVAILLSKILLSLLSKVFLPFVDFNYSFIFIFLHMSFFSIFYSFFKIIKNEIFSFHKEENWLETFSNSISPAAISFGTAFLSTFVISFLLNLLLKFLTNFFKIQIDFYQWIYAPNQAAIEFLSNISDAKYLNLFFWLIYIVVFAPICEEICFRGFLFDFFNKLFNKGNLDIFFVSFIFAFFHVFSFSNAIFAFVMSIFLTFYRKKTNSINISIWIHALTNFTLLLSAIIYYQLARY